MASGDSADEQCICNPLTILDVLKAPKLSDLTRKRSIDSNPPPKGKRLARGEGSSEPKTVTPSQRVKQFTRECLTTSAGTLFCTACREELSLRKNIIVASVKQQDWERKTCPERGQTGRYWKANDEVNHPVGETLPMAQRVYRVKVLKSFLRAAVPLAKLASFQEQTEIKNELSRRPVCFIRRHYQIG